MNEEMSSSNFHVLADAKNEIAKVANFGLESEQFFS